MKKVIKSEGWGGFLNEGWDFIQTSEGWNGAPNEAWGYISASEGWDGND